MQAVATPPAPPMIQGRNSNYTYNTSPRPLPVTPSIANQSVSSPVQSSSQGLVQSVNRKNSSKLFRVLYKQQMEKTKIKENVFGDVLRFKTKQFPVPFNVQYCGKSEDGKKVILSDGKKTTTVRFSSKYDYLFEGGVLSMYDILTIFEIKREFGGSKELFVDNISKDKLVQIGSKIGSPTMLT